jgi:hypothetical protein
MDLWDRVWKDKRGQVVIWQMPNFWLIAWAVLDIASLVTNGRTSNILWWAGTIDLGIWAVLEIIMGTNYFRRLLGLIILLLAIGSALKLGL